MNIRHSLAWMLLGQGSAFVFQFTSSIVLARYLAPYEVGVYAVAAAVLGLLSVMQAFGLQNLIIREKELTPELLASAFSINAGMAVLLSGATAALSLLGAAVLKSDDVQKVLLVLCVIPLLTIFDFLPFSQIERAGRFKIIAILATLSSLVVSLCTIGFVLAGFSYMSMAYAQIIGAILNTVLLNIIGIEFARFRLGLHEWKRVTDFAFQMFAVAGVNSLTTRLSEILLARILGLSAMGTYNRASNLNGLIWNNVHLLLGRVLFTDFSRTVRMGVSLRASYLDSVAMITAILWPTFAGLALLAGPFIYHVYGERWLPAAVPVALLAISSMCLVAITMTWELFAATGELRTQTKIESFRSVISLSLFAGGCWFGLAGAAGSRILDAIFAIWLYRPHLNRMTDTTTGDFSSTYATSAFLTLLAVGPTAILLLVFDFSPDLPLTHVALAVVSGVALWIVGLILTSHPLAREIRLVIRRVSASN